MPLKATNFLSQCERTGESYWPLKRHLKNQAFCKVQSKWCCFNTQRSCSKVSNPWAFKETIQILSQHFSLWLCCVGPCWRTRMKKSRASVLCGTVLSPEEVEEQRGWGNQFPFSSHHLCSWNGTHAQHPSPVPLQFGCHSFCRRAVPQLFPSSYSCWLKKTYYFLNISPLLEFSLEVWINCQRRLLGFLLFCFWSLLWSKYFVF